MQSSRWQRVSAVIDADFERYIRAGQASDTIELTQSGLLAYHAERNREAERRERESNLHDAPPLTEQGPFDALCADPPWRYGTGTGSRAIENHYPTTTTGRA